jgi:HJR/Mrr/RecB family endonuclease
VRQQEIVGFPLRCAGRRKYDGTDLRLRHGDLASRDGDLELVTGIAGLAQKIEIRLLTTEAEWARMSARSSRGAPTPPAEPWRPPEAIDVENRMRALAQSPSGDYFEELSAAHIVGDDLEIEFRATGYPGTYVHRIALAGPIGVYEVVPVPKASIFAVDRINDTLLAELANDPAGLDRLHDREFEHVIARLITRMGYEVELTRATRDDGVDIFALRRDGFAPWLTVVDCKRYRPDHRFGPDIVRTIAGVREQHNATTGMIVTTARFTDGARNLVRDRWPREVALVDRDRVVDWLKAYGWERHNGVWKPQN